MNYFEERTIILAIGSDLRMHPVTLNRPKPLIPIDGIRIIYNQR